MSLKIAFALSCKGFLTRQIVDNYHLPLAVANSLWIFALPAQKNQR